MAEIRVENLHKAFSDFVAVQGSNFTVESGEFFCLLGPSGCGKTTTLRMIAGLELPTSGRILLDGEDVTCLRAARRDIAFVFQLFALYPHMSVSKNIGFPLKCLGMGRLQIRERVTRTAQILRITHLMDRSISRLSSGDRQRVALGRAIVREPKAFLMDEPLGALDTEFRHVMTGELRALHDRLRATTIYVTHDQLEAMAMADKIVVMNKGAIEQLGTPREVYDRPASVFVADFIGSPPMNFLPFHGRIEHGAQTVGLGSSQIAVPRIHEDLGEGEFVLGVRPEQIEFVDHGRLRGVVFGAEYLGTTQIVTLNTAHGMVRARVPADMKVQIGDHLGLAFRPEKLSLFDKKSGRAISTALTENAVDG